MRFAVRHDKSLALLFVDIDHFKKINDTYGHQAGDEVLAGVARVMTATIRAEDVLARYGGEEFAIICREIEPRARGAGRAAARGGRGASASSTTGKVIPVTISVGAAVGPQGRRRAARSSRRRTRRCTRPSARAATASAWPSG